MDPLLSVDPCGLYCAAGDFHVDPWRPVPRAVVTHAHGDHLTRGCGRYLVAHDGRTVTAVRLGSDARIQTAPYGETLSINGVTVSLHPAGHILGSAQVRIEHAGHVAVVTGDFKAAPGATAAAFEPVPCHTLVPESTFALPIYRWPDEALVAADIAAWWDDARQRGRTAVLFAYALGKAQRLLALLPDPLPGPVFTHGAVERLTEAYRHAGVHLPRTHHASSYRADNPDHAGALVVAPPSTRASPWLRRFGDVTTAFASGWMRVRGTRRRRAVDRGFVLSDHADWPGLLRAIEATGAERVLPTHGYTEVLARWCRECGLDAEPLPTAYAATLDDEEATPTLDDEAHDTGDDEATP
ncbi:MAG: ligase-associated DNA damage response exonuclease [Rubricoccaceae bacterium]|nr:ligase-associated DNA damage response exonuclease [Rubricoccaceae bacterium]